eukprot:TRINITY_DN4291_c0_g1_i1.p3 TRINITY_DN4291_c0_g1~~TRINITY_DN4291_c0_g1_i1.p3  ORF type:complete len:102 (+),score=3.31 TRINITY_DN4291_c0_g1_i1:388-693(+)
MLSLYKLINLDNESAKQIAPYMSKLFFPFIFKSKDSSQGQQVTKLPIQAQPSDESQFIGPIVSRKFLKFMRLFKQFASSFIDFYPKLFQALIYFTQINNKT